MARDDVQQELAEIASDLRQVVENLEMLQRHCPDCVNLAGVSEARDHVDALTWRASNLLFWSNYSVRSDVTC